MICWISSDAGCEASDAGLLASAAAGGVRFIVVDCPIFDAPFCHPLEQLHLTEPLPRRLRRYSAPLGSGRHVAMHDAGGGDLRPLPDRNMIVDADAGAKDHEIAKRDASGNAGLGDQNAMAADHHIVAHLDQVVDLGSLAYDCIPDGAAVDRGAGADLDIVLDDDPPDLRHLEMARRAHDVAEAILSDPAARVNDDPVADQRMQHRGAGADRAV